MDINFNGFNMGNMQFNQNAFEEIQKICAEHPNCKECPIYNDYGLHSENNCVTICHKVEERMAKEQYNGNNGQM